MIRQPMRPFGTFRDAKNVVCSGWLKGPNATECPCLDCNGSGLVIHPNESYDPVEGYKNARKIACNHCNGTGIGTKVEFMNWYHEKITKYKQEKKIYDQEVKRIRKIFSKITKKDFELLKRYFAL